MRINTNLTAMNTYTQYSKNSSKIASSVAKLSSGYAINTAADNAAGLAISEKMRAQIRGLGKSASNAQDAISLVQTAEGALSSSTDILQRMRELAVQSSSDTNANEIDRTALQDEFSQLQSELNDVAKNTTFNKKNLLDGSLATVSKNLGTATLANSGMTVQLGNAATGDYKFSTTTQLVSAAVAAKKPNTPELVTDGAGTYFSGSNTISLGANTAASALLNGNYTLSASYSDPANDNGDGQITVTASGDNGQSFQAKLTSASLATLGTSKALSLNFNSQADDAFNISLNLSSNITGSENNFDTLASNISKLTVSVSGGVTAKEAQFGVFANLTGAAGVKLESGMSSVTFGNGVKVNFDTLTATSVDTSNQASISTANSAGGPSAVNTLAAMTAGGNTVGGQTVATATLGITDTNKYLAEGNYNVKSDASGVLTATDSAGNTFTATAQTTSGFASTAAYANYTFADTKNSAHTFSAALALSATANFGASQTISFTGTMTGTRGYALSKTAAGTAATLSNFTFADDSVIANGALSIKAADDGTTTTFTATDANAKTYTASVTNAAMTSGTASGAVKNTLSFTGTGVDKAAGFTVDLSTTNNGVTGTTFTNNATVLAGVKVANAGHNYDASFGTANITTVPAGTTTAAGAIIATAASASAFNDGSTGTFSGFTSQAGSYVTPGAMKITTTLAGGNVFLTAVDAAGRTYNTIPAAETAWLSNNGAPTVTNSNMKFTDVADGSNVFTLNFSTTNVNALSTIKTDAVGTTVNVTGAVTAASSATNYASDSGFSVESKKNAGLTFQVGANQGDEMTINVEKMDANYLGIASASVATRSAASAAIKTVDSAINQVSQQRANLGAIQNRLEYKISNLNTSSENLTSAESQIRDVDMAKEMTNFTNANILNQAATAMLAQANSLPQSVLSLIGK